MVDIAPLGVRADDNPWDPQPVAILVYRRRHHMVVRTSPAVPGEKNRSRAPVRAPHQGIDETGDIALSGADRSRGMFAYCPRWDNP